MASGSCRNTVRQRIAETCRFKSPECEHCGQVARPNTKQMKTMKKQHTSNHCVSLQNDVCQAAWCLRMMCVDCDCCVAVLLSSEVFGFVMSNQDLSLCNLPHISLMYFAVSCTYTGRVCGCGLRGSVISVKANSQLSCLCIVWGMQVFLMYRMLLCE